MNREDTTILLAVSIIAVSVAILILNGHIDVPTVDNILGIGGR